MFAQKTVPYFILCFTAKTGFCYLVWCNYANFRLFHFTINILINSLTAWRVILEPNKQNYCPLHVHCSDIIYMDRKFKSFLLFFFLEGGGAVMLISLFSACFQMVCQQKKVNRRWN